MRGGALTRRRDDGRARRERHVRHGRLLDRVRLGRRRRAEGHRLGLDVAELQVGGERRVCGEGSPIISSIGEGRTRHDMDRRHSRMAGLMSATLDYGAYVRARLKIRILAPEFRGEKSLQLGSPVRRRRPGLFSLAHEPLLVVVEVLGLVGAARGDSIEREEAVERLGQHLLVVVRVEEAVEGDVAQVAVGYGAELLRAQLLGALLGAAPGRHGHQMLTADICRLHF